MNSKIPIQKMFSSLEVLKDEQNFEYILTPMTLDKIYQYYNDKESE